MVGRFRLRLHCFVLMDNHYHLLLELREPNLSRAVQSEPCGAVAQRQSQRMVQPTARAQRPFVPRALQIGGGESGGMGPCLEPLRASESGAPPELGAGESRSAGSTGGFVARAC